MARCIIDFSNEPPPGHNTELDRCFFFDNAVVRCEGCGETIPMPGGVLSWVTAVVEAFEQQHERCRDASNRWRADQ